MVLVRNGGAWVDSLKTRRAGVFENFNPGGGGEPLAVIGASIDSNGASDTSHLLAAPTHAGGDLLVAAMMWRLGAANVTPPSGWTLYGSYLGSQMQFNQQLHVYTKTATGAEPASYTWSAVSSVRNCGLMVAVRGGQISGVSEYFGNGETLVMTDSTVEGLLNLTVATWIYADTLSPEAYSQTGLGATEISDSPLALARISGSYTTQASTVTSTHFTTTTANNPNHCAICIRFDAA